jgi:hypothetical protein
MPPIEFHSKPWTVREMLLATRLERNSQDIEAIVALLVSRSNASEETILALEVGELEPLIVRLAEALKTAAVLGSLSKNWSAPKR